MRVLVDTNILLRSAQPNHTLCPQATHAVSKLLRERAAVFFCSQNIAEFWNVASRPAERNGLGFSHSEVLLEIRGIESLLTLLPDIPAIYPVWKELVRDHSVQGVKVYDARLVAIMSVYAVDARHPPAARPFKKFTRSPQRQAAGDFPPVNVIHFV
jgi:predicted nucleic acid-binding protein